MGLFKDDDMIEANEFNLDDSALSDFADNFADSNVDKNLLNEIFANDSTSAGNVQLDIGSDSLYTEEKQEIAKESLTEELTEEIVEEAKTVEPVTEESTQKPAKEEDSVQESEKTTELGEDYKKPTEPVKTSANLMPVNDDIVNEEAMKAMNEERLNGTVTVITENTTITGSISSDGSLEVRGTITGDIECQGKVYINGIVSGGVSAAEIYVNTPRLNGGLLSEGTIKIGVGTVVLGDVSGASAYVAGAVRGNIDVDGPLTIESTAILKGDIKAKSININPGAVIEGYYSLHNSEIDLNKFFE